MYDYRLIGRWRSDARKTNHEIDLRRHMPAKKTAKLRSLFGKLELRYTRSLCYLRMGNYKSVSQYQVVAKDEWSVAIVTDNPVSGKQIHHIHFEGNRYWIYLGFSGLREFFRRIR